MLLTGYMLAKNRNIVRLYYFCLILEHERHNVTHEHELWTTQQAGYAL